jgi:hypothetical protein
MDQEQVQPGGNEQNSGFSQGPGGVDDGMVTVNYGCYNEPLPVNGMTVGQIRNKYGDRFDIDTEAVAIVDGQEVSEDTMVSSGSTLLFSRKSGEKG